MNASDDLDICPDMCRFETRKYEQLRVAVRMVPRDIIELPI